MSKFLIRLILYYQKNKPSLMKNQCRFYPSCSTYAIQSILKYGWIKGTIKAIFRIIRCNPFSKGGYDPVK